MGCFVSIDNTIFALTCHHVVPQGIFQQPSAQITAKNYTIQTKRAKLDLSKSESTSEAGSAAYGIYTIKNHKTLDYQILSLTRDVMNPLNTISVDGKELSQDIILEPPENLDLNNLDHAFELLHSRQSFVKYGAASQLTDGVLYNSSRLDCYVKISKKTNKIPESVIITEGGEAHHTCEFAFKGCDDSKFAQNGDSGAIIYCNGGEHDTKVVAMVIAVDIDSGITWATPIHDIINDVKERFGKELVIPKSN